MVSLFDYRLLLFSFDKTQLSIYGSSFIFSRVSTLYIQPWGSANLPVRTSQQRDGYLDSNTALGHIPRERCSLSQGSAQGIIGLKSER